ARTEAARQRDHPRVHGDAAGAPGVAGPASADRPATGTPGPGPDLPSVPRSRGMMLTLIRKLLRDLRLALAVVALLLGAFQCLWYKVTERIIAELAPFFTMLASLGGLTPKDVQDVLFAGPGKIVRTLVGGDQLDFDSVMDMLSIGYVHPLMQTI